jgi:hypothetical protein
MVIMRPPRGPDVNSEYPAAMIKDMPVGNPAPQYYNKITDPSPKGVEFLWFGASQSMLKLKLLILSAQHTLLASRRLNIIMLGASPR